MKTSESIDLLITALATAQLSMPTIPRNGKNPHFKSRYPTLDDVLGAIRVPLANNGLCLIQGATTVDGRILVTSRLFHKSGQWIETELSIKPDKDTAQAIGSVISYGKRYLVLSMLALETGEDDDGNAASGIKTPPPHERSPVLFDKNNPSHMRAIKNFLDSNSDMELNLNEFITALSGKLFTQSDIISTAESMGTKL